MQKYVLLLLILLFISCQEESEPKLTIATAANMQYAIQALQQAFTNETGINCEIIISSSGKLTAQIKAGAPFDIFVSADMKYPTDLHKNNYTISPPKVYAQGLLVLWTMQEDVEISIDLLSQKDTRHIALANPKTAPYGEAAMDVLAHYDLSNKVKSKLVFGENIAQSNQFIASGVADIGFTSKSAVLAAPTQNKGQWIALDTSIYKAINQGIVLVKNNKKLTKEAQSFYNFLFSTKGRKILTNFGYVVD